MTFQSDALFKHSFLLKMQREHLRVFLFSTMGGVLIVACLVAGVITMALAYETLFGTGSGDMREWIAVGLGVGAAMGISGGAPVGVVYATRRLLLSKRHRILIGMIAGGCVTLGSGLFWGALVGYHSGDALLLGKLLLFEVFGGWMLANIPTNNPLEVEQAFLREIRGRYQQPFEQALMQATHHMQYETTVRLAKQLQEVLDIETICQITGLTEEDIKKGQS